MPSPPGLGLFYLVRSYKAEPPINPDTIPGVTNPHMIGMLWRESWDRIKKNGIHSASDWAFLDACFASSNAHGKTSALQITAGITSPPSFFDLPGVQTLITGSGLEKCSVPWDPVFQTEWESLQTEMAARYKHDPTLKYVCISGVGTISESFLAITPQEIADADALAVAAGYANKDDAWRAGVTWNIDMMIRVWSPIPVLLVTGAPFGTAPGSAEDLQAMFSYGDTTYRGQFGARGDDLDSNQPVPGRPSASFVQPLSPHCSAVGYQFGNHQNVNDPAPPTRLDAALVRGTDMVGAHFMEVFSDDADDPVSGRALDAANARMFGTPLPPLPSPTPSGTPGGNPDGPSFPSGGLGKPNWWPPAPDVIPPWL